MLYRTGKLPKVIDERTLQLARYLSPALRRRRRAATTRGSSSVPAGARCGACSATTPWATARSPAGARRHALGRVRRGPALRITDAMVIHAYSKVTGYVPGDRAPTAARACSTRSLAAQAGHRSTDRARLRRGRPARPRQRKADHRLVRLRLPWRRAPGRRAAALPALPQWTCSPDGSPEKRPNPQNGHCVIYGGYNAVGPRGRDLGHTVQVCGPSTPPTATSSTRFSRRRGLGRLARADQPVV